MTLGKTVKLKDSGLLVKLTGVSHSVFLLSGKVHHQLDLTYQMFGEEGYVPRRPFQEVFELVDSEKSEKIIRTILSCVQSLSNEPRGQTSPPQAPLETP